MTKSLWALGLLGYKFYKSILLNTLLYYSLHINGFLFGFVDCLKVFTVLNGENIVFWVLLFEVLVGWLFLVTMLVTAFRLVCWGLFKIVVVVEKFWPRFCDIRRLYLKLVTVFGKTFSKGAFSGPTTVIYDFIKDLSPSTSGILFLIIKRDCRILCTFLNKLGFLYGINGFSAISPVCAGLNVVGEAKTDPQRSAITPLSSIASWCFLSFATSFLMITCDLYSGGAYLVLRFYAGFTSVSSSFRYYRSFYRL